MLSGCRDQRADHAEAFRTFLRATDVRYFLPNPLSASRLKHPRIQFRQIVGKGYLWIGQDALHVLFINMETERDIVTNPSRRTPPGASW